MDRTDVVALLGFALLVVGVGLFSVPLALVIAGLVLLVGSQTLNRPEATDG